MNYWEVAFRSVWCILNFKQKEETIFYFVFSPIKELRILGKRLSIGLPKV